MFLFYYQLSQFSLLVLVVRWRGLPVAVSGDVVVFRSSKLIASSQFSFTAIISDQFSLRNVAHDHGPSHRRSPPPIVSIGQLTSLILNYDVERFQKPSSLGTLASELLNIGVQTAYVDVVISFHGRQDLIDGSLVLDLILNQFSLDSYYSSWARLKFSGIIELMISDSIFLAFPLIVLTIVRLIIMYQIINVIMSGRDVLVIMVAGGGKSLCYQLPSGLHHGIALGSFLTSLDLQDFRVVLDKELGLILKLRDMMKGFRASSDTLMTSY
uniref:Uncharacterized protein n=1 Tax=Lactuca sativa TaxID=4236 RepID=A0A9R1XXK9_LACSA|nr:hypothetical protein LSAT_V11C100026360 [Lactuca sativa]